MIETQKIIEEFNRNYKYFLETIDRLKEENTNKDIVFKTALDKIYNSDEYITTIELLCNNGTYKNTSGESKKYISFFNTIVTTNINDYIYRCTCYAKETADSEYKQITLVDYHFTFEQMEDLDAHLE